MSDRAVIRDSMLLPGGDSRNAVSSTYSGPLLAIPPSKSSTVWRRVPTRRAAVAASTPAAAANKLEARLDAGVA